MKYNKNLVYFAILLLLAVVLYLFMASSSPSITTIHSMNLDKDKERWAAIEKKAAAGNIPLQRWPATYGKDIPYEKLRDLGVGHAMVRPDRHDKEHKKLVNLGVVGCFISTRRLLEHLSGMYVGSSAGHLILDDDVDLPADLLSPGGKWEQIRHTIPGDWDIIYLGIWDATGDTVNPNVKKLRLTDKQTANLGTFAYIVRHGAIKTKILPWLTYMVDAIDEQYAMKFNEWNVYAVTPNIIGVNEAANEKSSINEIN
jgi:hypothetical protein